MKSSFSKKKINKKIKSLDVKNSLKMKNIFKKKKKLNRSVRHNSASIYEDAIKDLSIFKSKDEISKLSNANLNIIKILNSCAKEEILNDSSFSFYNDINTNQSVKGGSKAMNRMLVVSPIPGFKKRKKQLNNNFLLNSNISDFSSEILFSDKRNDSIRGQSRFLNNSQNKKNSEKEIKKSNSVKSRKNFGGSRPLSENNLTKYTLNNNKLKSKDKKISNKNITEIIKNNHLNNSRDNKQIKPRPKSKSIVFRDNDYLSKKINNLPNISESVLFNNNNNIKEFLNEIEIMKINENIHNDINFIQLKKKNCAIKKKYSK
jgi:hypothetical protein